MKRELLIKKIASEFNTDETEVSKYFDNIFDSLTAAFLKNKNVNISEFGKFKVKVKTNEEGEKQKTILFSPVKKFADDINYYFNELAPVQIRILDEKVSEEKLVEGEYPVEDAEEIILIDFEGEEIIPETKEIEITEATEEKIPEEILIHEDIEQEFIFSKEEQSVKEDILIPEEASQKTLFTEDVQKVKEDIVIPEDKEQDFVFSKEEQGVKEDVLIHEETSHEIVYSKEEHTIKEEVLIPEETKQENPFENIHKEKKEETQTENDVIAEKERILEQLDIMEIPEIILPDFDEIISLHKLISKDKKIISEVSTLIKIKEKKEKTQKVIAPEITETSEQASDSEIRYAINAGKERILEQLNLIVIPEIILPDFDEIISLHKLISKDKKIVSEVSAIIKIEEKKEIIPEVSTKEEETILFIPKDKIEEEIKEPETKIEDEITIKDIPEIVQEEKTEDIIEPELPQKEEDTVLFVPAEEKTEEEEKEHEQVIEEEIIHKEASVNIPDEKETEPENTKTNLQLEAELLKMLDERRKILEEIKKLEEIDTDDLIDLSKRTVNSSDEKPKLIDDNTLDLTKQNIFVSNDVNALEDILKNMDAPEIPEEADTEPEITEETVNEDIIENEIPDESKPEEVISDDKLYTGEDINELENLLSSLYSGNEETGKFPEPKEVEPHMNNLEMKVFDKLLDEPEKENETPESGEIKQKEISNGDLTSFSELEKMFVNFRTEKTEDDIIKEEDKTAPVEEKPEVKKTETIKTYDDIFNLLEPNGKKKQEKKPEPVKEIQKKILPPNFKIIIYAVSILIIIIACVLLYKKAVYKSTKESKQLPITATIDSTKVESSDSVVFADTNKTKELVKEDVVYDENDVVIKESEKGFIVQFGNYENQFELAKKIKELKDKKIYPNFEKIDLGGKQVYKLRIGPYKSLKEAKAIIPKL